MDRQMDPAEARILLETLQVGRLGLVLPSGRPYVVPVNFVFLDGRVYVHSAREGSKVEAIAANPHVCFELDEPQGTEPSSVACDVSYHYRSVVAFGKAVQVDDPVRKKEILDEFARKYAPGAAGTVRQASADRTLVFEISLDSITGKKSPAPRRQDDGAGPRP